MTPVVAWPPDLLAALAGLAGGIVLGLAGRRGDLCSLGALEHALYGGDRRRVALWGVVLGVAIVATQGAAAAGWIDLAATIYHGFQFSAAAAILGGLTFGYGMALAGNCGFGALTRAGGGDIRALIVVLVMGVAAFATLSGPLAPLRVRVFPQAEAQGPAATIAGDLAAMTGLPAGLWVVALATALLGAGLRHPGVRRAPATALWGAAAGLAIAGCLLATSALSRGSLGAVPVEGLSFTAPVGRALHWLMTSTAGGLSFPVGAVAGTALGGFLGTLGRGTFRWEACDDPRELGRTVVGAALMGIGGTVAMGCTVGQGMTGIATLAWSGPVTLAAIAAGGALGLRRLLARG